MKPITLIFVLLCTACAPLSPKRGAETIQIGELRFSDIGIDSSAPSITLCFDLRANFDLQTFARERNVVSRYFWAKSIHEEIGGVGGFGPAYMPPLFHDKDGNEVYYGCVSGTGPRALTPFFYDRLDTGLTREDWMAVLKHRDQYGYEDDLMSPRIGQQHSFYGLIEAAAMQGGIWLTPVFMRLGWFPTYIEFPPLFLKIDLEHLEAARRYDPEHGCAGDLGSVFWDKCVPAWAQQELSGE